MSAKVDPELCRGLAEALSSGGGLMIDRRTFAAQLTAAAELAEQHEELKRERDWISQSRDADHAQLQSLLEAMRRMLESVSP